MMMMLLLVLLSCWLLVAGWFVTPAVGWNGPWVGFSLFELLLFRWNPRDQEEENDTAALLLQLYYDRMQCWPEWCFACC